jgi:hypothetical protein
LGGGNFVAEILKEADQKVTRYLPVKNREALIRKVIQKICQGRGWERRSCVWAVRLGELQACAGK